MVRPARAQFLDRVIDPNLTGETVATRVRPDYEPPEVRIGTAIVSAIASESTGYDDDVTGFKPFPGSSLEETTGSVAMRTDWPQDALYGSISVDDRRYLDLPQQSTTNWNAGLGISVHLGLDLLSFTYNHENLEETSRDAESADLDRPVQTRSDDAVLLYQAVFNWLTLQPAFDFTAYRFGNGTIGGVPFSEEARERNVYAPSLTARYELAPLSELVALVQYSLGRYVYLPPGQASLNYDDVTALAGYETSLGDLWRLVLLGGYEQRSFQSSRYSTISAPIARLQVIWQPTGLTAVTGSLTRRISDTNNDFTASTQITDASLRVDHEFLPNLLFHAQAGIELADYAGSNGQVILYTAGAGVDWKLNRYVALSATYELQKRDTSGLDAAASTPGITNNTLGPSYLDNRYLLQLRFTL